MTKNVQHFTTQGQKEKPYNLYNNEKSLLNLGDHK